NSSNHLPGSISIASRLLFLATPFLSGPTFTAKLSDKECAGSVENISTRFFRSFAARESAKAAAAVVFPTPPLPPKMYSRRPPMEKAEVRLEPVNQAIERARPIALLILVLE